MASGAMRPVDEAIRAAIHMWASDDATSLAHVLGFAGSVPIWVGMTFAGIAAFWRLGWRHAAMDLALVMAGAVVLGNSLKLMFARARPEALFGELPSSFSFPSGHALFNASLYIALACLIQARTPGPALGATLWIAAILIAGAIGLSRIYLGVHYPSDIVAGFLVAAGVIGAVTALRASDEK
jgi:undecaprenyl-diphosphatase